MTTSSLPVIRLRLAQLTSHLVVALIALVVIGGSTRVMEAGLACPDWPLCYGSLFPGRQMNLQVFLEWFHRLDAFLVGVAVLAQFWVSLRWRKVLPTWLPFISGLLVLMVGIQGGLGALTVLQLLPSGVVSAHLVLALTLVAMVSGITQRLFSRSNSNSPFWWRLMGVISLFAVIIQSLLGGQMATAWAAQRCRNFGQACELIDFHRFSAVLTSATILSFVLVAFIAGGWPRSQWRFLLSVVGLLIIQITLGVLTLRFGSFYPTITISHQLVAALLVAFLAALVCRRPDIPTKEISFISEISSPLEHCHG
ncbi:COX15/CtaA family protein [Prochlorococcus sp. MIT 1300]|uniref:COX15/CtaA family protein n=1 Tax=Prochlorococcus sp. MIT 1300 TaxID=3096218 RepID=UPI002A75DBF6|nr:COX15/CtaA family protein [Prochlorococcus sp. MIT 1300]